MHVYKILNNIDSVDQDKRLTMSTSRTTSRTTRGHSNKIFKTCHRLNVRANSFINDKVVNTWHSPTESVVSALSLNSRQDLISVGKGIPTSLRLLATLQPQQLPDETNIERRRKKPHAYEGQSEITEPYLIIFKSSKMDSFLDDISLKLYVIYSIT